MKSFGAEGGAERSEHPNEATSLFRWLDLLPLKVINIVDGENVMYFSVRLRQGCCHIKQDINDDSE